MKEILNRCSTCGKVIPLAVTYLLAEGSSPDIVRTVCRGCYIRKSRELRRVATREREEGFVL